MDDLQVLAEKLAKPGPSDEVVSRGRKRLVEAARHGRTRRRTGWLAGGLGLATAAATAGIVVASGVTTPGVPGPRARGPARRATHPAVAASSAGRKVLLAAATTVARQHTATYWRFKIKVVTVGAPPKLFAHTHLPIVNTFQTWTARDGNFWTSQPACAGLGDAVVFRGPGEAGFSLGSGGNLTYRQTEHLPTAPAALDAWFARYQHTTSFVAGALIALQYEVPTPPRVRAAAFRALAALPGVRSLGPVRGGQALLLSFPGEPRSYWVTVVVDPATGLIRSETSHKLTTRVEIAEWTNRLPRVVPLPGKYACSG